MLPDDDKRYAIETYRSRKSVLKRWFKINDIQSVHLFVVWYLVNLQDARRNNKDSLGYYFWYFYSDWDKSDCTVVRNILPAGYIYTNDLAKSHKGLY